MRLWSIHPRYLDRQGLTALWRESLLAQKVLAGRTRGYHHHPQLARFRECADPLATIGAYLAEVAQEATRRGYHFNDRKILKRLSRTRPLAVERGQLGYEREHLLKKLKKRDPALFAKWAPLKTLRPHPLFRAVKGGIAPWEKNIE